MSLRKNIDSIDHTQLETIVDLLRNFYVKDCAETYERNDIESMEPLSKFAQSDGKALQGRLLHVPLRRPLRKRRRIPSWKRDDNRRHRTGCWTWQPGHLQGLRQRPCGVSRRYSQGKRRRTSTKDPWALKAAAAVKQICQTTKTTARILVEFETSATLFFSLC